MKSHRGSRRAGKLFHNALEVLEQRRMLTQLQAGDTFRYQNEEGEVAELVVTGGGPDTILDLIGATSLPIGPGSFGQTARAHPLPGLITKPNGQQIEVLGGIGGANGITGIADVTGAANSRTNLSDVPNLAPTDQINVGAIASNNLGKTWGFDLFTDPDGFRHVKLINFAYQSPFGPFGTVFTDLGTQLLTLAGADLTADDPTQALVAIQGADFNPFNDNQLFFVATVTVPRNSLDDDLFDPPADTDVPFLFMVDLATGTPPYDVDPPAVTLIGEFGSVNPGNPFTGNFSDLIPDISGITFRDNGQIITSGTFRKVINIGTDDQNVIEQYGLAILNLGQPLDTQMDFSEGDPGNIVVPILDNDVVDDIVALEVVPGAGDANFTYATSGTGSDATLLRIRLSDGLVTNYGTLTDPDQAGQNRVRGENISDITWNKKLTSPFKATDDDPRNDNEKGILIGADTDTDELVVVESRERFPNANLFAIYGVNTTPDTSLAFAVLDDEGRMLPFTDDAGIIRHVNADTGEIVNTNLPDGTGAAFLGLRTVDTVDSTTDEENFAFRRVSYKRANRAYDFAGVPSDAKFIYAGINIRGDMKDILIGGTVSGRVAIEGSVNTLYAGAFITGDPQGRRQNASYNDVSGNIYTSGDLRKLISLSSIGTMDDDADANGQERLRYMTGAHVEVGGHLGAVRVLDAYVGRVTVRDTFGGHKFAQEEIEAKAGDAGAENIGAYFHGDVTGEPELGTNVPEPRFFNDTFATAEFLGTSLNTALGNRESVVVNGSIDNSDEVDDRNDYFAVSVMAGQKITVQLNASVNAPGVAPNVGVYDPTGRLIATDHNHIAPGVTRGRAFQFVADRPGVYRFAVGFSEDGHFNGRRVVVGQAANYTLRVTGLANLALGSVVANNNIFFADQFNNAIDVRNGDVGAILAGLDNINDGGGNSNGVDRIIADGGPVSIEKGNLRTMLARSFGMTNGHYPLLSVPRGSVGLLQTTDTTGLMRINDTIGAVDTFTGLPNTAVAIGGDFQTIDAAGQLRGDFSANRGFGNIRAASVVGGYYFIANADRTGDDGIVDLADISGDWGDLTNGGPSVLTGPNGNWRYLRVGGNVFASRKFGSGLEEPVTYEPGQSVRLTDDSGTPVKISLTNTVRNQFPIGDLDEFLSPGVLTIRTFGVDDSEKGGVIVTQIAVDAPGTAQNLANHGLSIETGDNGGTGSFDVGEILTFNTGRDPIETVNLLVSPRPVVSTLPRREGEGVTVEPDQLSPVDLTFKGSRPVNVWSIEARNKPGTALANLDRVDNKTSGEIVNLEAASVELLRAETAGLAVSHTGENKSRSGNAVESRDIIDFAAINAEAAPVTGQRNAIYIHESGGALPGYLIDLQTRQGLGNVFVQGIISSVQPNADGANTKGVFEGINAPVVAFPTGNAANVTDARIQSINIGEGVASTGTGDIARSGIFAGDVIETVSNQGLGSDIRGVVQAGYLPGGLLGTDSISIGTIGLSDGAIIDGQVLIVGDLTDFQASFASSAVFHTFPERPDSAVTPTYDLEQIVINGKGGIIGTSIAVADSGTIDIKGFGFLNSELTTTGNGTVNILSTSGYGVRDSSIGFGAFVNSVVANGTGKTIDTNFWTPTLRNSSAYTFDPYTGQELNELTDLHRYLGTTADAPKRKGVSKEGIIEDSNIAGTNTLGKVEAWQIIGRQRTTRVSFANQINKVETGDAIDKLQLSTGRLRNFITGNDMSNSLIGVAGKMDTMNIGGTLRGNSRLSITGPEGSIGTLTVKNGLFSRIEVSANIGTISVGGNLGSPLVRTLQNMTRLDVAGSIVTGAFVDVKKALSTLIIGGNIDEGAVVKAQSNTTQDITGEVNGDLIIG